MCCNYPPTTSDSLLNIYLLLEGASREIKHYGAKDITVLQRMKLSYLNTQIDSNHRKLGKGIAFSFRLNSVSVI